MAEAKMLRTKLQFRRDVYSKWLEVDPVLASGEPALVLATETETENAFKFKIGNGVSKFSELPWANSIGSAEPTEIAVDSKSIIMDASGAIALNGFSDAAVGYIPSKGENGALVWVPMPTDGGTTDISALVTKVDKNTGDITEIKASIDAINAKLVNDYYTKEQVDAKMTSAYTPGETVTDVSALTTPPTQADVGVVHPIEQDSVATDDFINPGQNIPGGSQVVAVEQPDGTVKYDVLPAGTVNYTELLDKIEANTQNIVKNTNAIAANTQATDNVRTNLLNNYYNKTEIDSKVGSIYTPVPSVNDVASLPTPIVAAPGTVIPVVNGGISTGDFTNGAGNEVTPGSQVAVVEDNGVKKYEVLPNPVAPNLSNYATTAQLEEGLATKVSSVVAGDGTVFSKSEGSVTIPMATQLQLGLVKSSNTMNGVTVNDDGSMSVNKVSIDTIEQGDSIIELNGGSASN